MATFTIALKDAIKLDPTIVGGSLGHYPLFDENHREALNQKIVDHFYNREIGQETISMFKLALRRKLNEIMPLYNQHYAASAIQFNVLETINMDTTGTANGTVTGTGHSTTTSGSDAKSRAVASETPQTMLAGSEDYATSAQDNISNTAATGAADENSTQDQTQTTDSKVKGYQGNPALIIYQYRETLVNIDMMIINELEPLFMQIWANGDSFTPNGANPYGYFAYGIPLWF